ncbi:hypothetical protein P43SY_003818 [Pythium insidiosum]|uniref:Eukaryotic peptide chain release factor subunit 1 n=1 Tax=Pythium insidiosum TaxID=114742 RepID=A0AAD5M495_PYTIN|nr:hypothetical protein P43SY_003818 [Pythium insidiosum]
MATAVKLPIKFLADDAPTVKVSVGDSERTMQLDIVCANVLVRCVDDTKCPKACAGKVEVVSYTSYHKLDSRCMLPVNATVSAKGFTSNKNFRVGQIGLTDSWSIPTGTDGVFGLGPESRSSSRRISGSPVDSVLTSQLSSFSISLGATAADGGNVILNGMDDARIAEENLIGYNVKLDRGNGHDLDVKNILWDGVAVSSSEYDPYQLDTTIDEVHLSMKAWDKIQELFPPSCGYSMSSQAPSDDEQIQLFKMKKLIKSLQAARGNGTSMISLIIPPKDQISRVNKMLADEMGTASNIKSRVNRLSVLGAITSAQQRLKLYNRCPTNGLIIYCGAIITDEGKEKRVNIDFEPFKPINTSLYMCDNKFHTEALGELLQDNDRFGFIIMDGNGALYGTVAGNTRDILHRFSVDLPKKHGRGGQSALRFARLRMEKRHNYVRKVAEVATQMFITNDRPNVTGLVLAGSADFKNELNGSDMFDKRLADIVVKVVDVSYGGENGFNQAIELSAETLANVKFVQEKRLICKYMEEIAQDSGKYCFGISDTMKALDMGAVETLIVWEDLPHHRITLRNETTSTESVKILSPAEETIASNFIDAETGAKLEVVERTPLVEWFANNYKDFGTTLEFVTARSQEGSQFCKGFGGIGGILRWKVDFMELDYEPDEDDDDDDDDYFDEDAFL